MKAIMTLLFILMFSVGYSQDLYNIIAVASGEDEVNCCDWIPASGMLQITSYDSYSEVFIDHNRGPRMNFMINFNEDSVYLIEDDADPFINIVFYNQVYNVEDHSDWSIGYVHDKLQGITSEIFLFEDYSDRYIALKLSR